MKGRREDARGAAREWDRLAEVSPLALSADCPLISGTDPLNPDAGLNGPPVLGSLMPPLRGWWGEAVVLEFRVKRARAQANSKSRHLGRWYPHFENREVLGSLFRGAAAESARFCCYFSSLTQMLRKLMGGLGSPWACSLIGAVSYFL
jgi:hypothetical protein